MQLHRVDARAPDPDVLSLAADVLRAGGLVAFPTETVYGLGARALDERAVRAIFEAKGRPATNPVIAHVSSVEMARSICEVWPAHAERIAAALWPGPLTLVLPRAPHVPDAVTASGDSVGVRMPSHPVALGLIEALGEPVCAPSANKYTGVSPTSAAHVERSLGDRVDVILDGGPTSVGVESTVLSLLEETPRVLRPGMISAAQIADALGAPVHDHEFQVVEQTTAISPGLARKHYSPAGRVELVDEVDLSLLVPGVGVLFLGTPPAGVEGEGVRSLPDDPELYARGLYDALHHFDERAERVIYIQRPPDSSAWGAIWDRLRRAASE